MARLFYNAFFLSIIETNTQNNFILRLPSPIIRGNMIGIIKEMTEMEKSHNIQMLRVTNAVQQFLNFLDGNWVSLQTPHLSAQTNNFLSHTPACLMAMLVIQNKRDRGFPSDKAGNFHLYTFQVES